MYENQEIFFPKIDKLYKMSVLNFLFLNSIIELSLL